MFLAQRCSLSEVEFVLSWSIEEVVLLESLNCELLHAHQNSATFCTMSEQWR